MRCCGAAERRANKIPAGRRIVWGQLCRRSLLKTARGAFSSALLKLQISFGKQRKQNDSEYTLSLYEIDFFETTSFHGRNVIHGVRLRLSARGSGLFWAEITPQPDVLGLVFSRKSLLFGIYFSYITNSNKRIEKTGPFDFISLHFGEVSERCLPLLRSNSFGFFVVS